MALIDLGEAKQYLRVDSSDDDALISTIIPAAEKTCMDIARLELDDWDVICGSYTTEDDAPMIRGKVTTVTQLNAMRSILRIAVLFAIGYFYEHREEADHHELAMTLRAVLFDIREGVF